MKIEVNELSKVYGTQKAVDGISFSNTGNEVIGFLGPNGAGKSTTMKMLTSSLLPTSGNASILGYDIVKDSIEVRRRVGYLPESNPLYPDMYVKEFLQVISRMNNVKGINSRISDVIQMVGLEKEQHKKIGALSKGYKQRVGIAQALLHDPEILILDEPTSGLDANQLIEIRALIRRLAENKTILFSSHIMQEIDALCDRVLIINEGELVADSPIQDLRNQITGESEVILDLTSTSLMKEKYEKIKGVTEIIEEKSNRYLIRIKGSRDVRPDIFKAAVDAGDVIVGMNKKENNIESVFTKMTQKT